MTADLSTLNADMMVEGKDIRSLGPAPAYNLHTKFSATDRMPMAPTNASASSHPLWNEPHLQMLQNWDLASLSITEQLIPIISAKNA